MTKLGHINPDKFTVYPHEFIFRGDGHDSDNVDLCLPVAFIRMLQSTSDRFTWWTSYRDIDGNRIDISLSNRDIIERGIVALFDNDSCDVDTTDIETVYRYLHTVKKDNKMCCCCGCDNGQAPQIVLDYGSDVPYLEESPPSEDDNIDTDLLCDAAHQLLAGIRMATIRMEQTLDSIGVTAAAIEAAVSSILHLRGLVLTVTPVLLWNVLAPVLIYWKAQSFFGSAAGIIQEIQMDYICAVVGATSPRNSHDRWMAAVTKTRADYGTSMALYMWFWGKYIYWQWRSGVSTEDVEIQPEFQGSDCPCGFTPGGTSEQGYPIGDTSPIELVNDLQIIWLVACDQFIETGSQYASDATWEDMSRGILKITPPDNEEANINRRVRICPGSSELSAAVDWPTLLPFFRGWLVEVITLGVNEKLSSWLCGGSCMNDASLPFEDLGYDFYYRLSGTGSVTNQEIDDALQTWLAAEAKTGLAVPGNNPGTDTRLVTTEYQRVSGTNTPFFVRYWMIVTNGAL